MKIKKKLSQHRRDFRAIYICEHEDCKNEVEMSGYDDRNFHDNVIPKMECKKCGKKSPANYVPQGTKYAEHVTV